MKTETVKSQPSLMLRCSGYNSTLLFQPSEEDIGASHVQTLFVES